jgi:hypothetical protein
MPSIEENSPTKDDSVKAIEASAPAINVANLLSRIVHRLLLFKVGLACYATGFSQLAREISTISIPSKSGARKPTRAAMSPRHDKWGCGTNSFGYSLAQVPGCPRSAAFMSHSRSLQFRGAHKGAHPATRRPVPGGSKLPTSQ